jgi:DNA-directed RNA polymerase I, II, and III subunit RPABC2
MDDIEENTAYDNEDEYDVNDIIVEGNDDQNMIDILKKYNKHKKNYKTTPVLTKYEKCRVLSERANQINCGGQIFLSSSDGFSNAYDIAVKELNEKKIPFIIKRPYGNTFEYWKLKDLC